MGEAFIHFSAKPLLNVLSVQQNNRSTSRGDKPDGLWFSVEGNDDGWRWWCESEGYGLDRLVAGTEIVFSRDAKILRIGTLDEMDSFTERHKIAAPWERSLLHLGKRVSALNWPFIAQEYDAIIIAPYMWDRRLSAHSSWYYSWDCASGCVWNARAISELRPSPTGGKQP